MLPSFKTERLLLRPRSMADLEDCLSMDRDPLVTRYIPGPWSEPEKHRAFVLARIAGPYPEGFGYWSAIDRNGTGGFIGWLLLLPYDIARGEVEIGWRFTRQSWGRGYATEAASAILAHAFRTVRPEVIVADIHALNAGSIRVAEKLGMCFVEERCIDGEPAKSYQLRAPPR